MCKIRLKIGKIGIKKMQNWTKNGQIWAKNGQIWTKYPSKSNIFGHCDLVNLKNPLI